jgi:hypothetical protein
MHIPGPPPLWLLGNLVTIARLGQEKAYVAWGKQYGPVFLVWMGAIPTVVVESPQLARCVVRRSQAAARPAPTSLAIPRPPSTPRPPAPAPRCREVLPKHSSRHKVFNMSPAGSTDERLDNSGLFMAK